MAEAVIIGIAVEIVANLVPQAIERVGKLWGVKHELEVLRDTVSTLQAELYDAKEKYRRNEQIQVWVDKLKIAFYDAQDVLEEFKIEVMRRDLRGHNEMVKEVRTFLSSSNQLAFKLKMSYKVRAVRERIKVIEASKTFSLDKRPPDSRVEREWSREETHSFIPEGVIIGRDDDKEKVMELLLDSDVQENVSILPIVGIGGLGKTALAQCVYNDKMVSEHFHLKMWVCVSDDFDVTKIMKNIIACAQNEEFAMEVLQSKLRAEIDGKRYLLVLDDVWTIGQETWQRLEKLLKGGARGSKILITTRFTSVAEITGTLPPHPLKGLSESASLELLMQMACHGKEKIQDPKMLAIGKEIAQKCYGVPLVVRAVGNLLFYKTTELEWSRFKNYELQEVSEAEGAIMNAIMLCYDHLPSHSKQCFAFCSLFPKDYEMDKQTLVDLWMAEGFIQPSRKSKHLEDIAHGYFMDLLWSNFFQEYKEHPDGRVTCKMHDLMHDIACLVAGTEYSATWDHRRHKLQRPHHISHDLTSTIMGKLPISHLKASALRTILRVTKYKGSRSTSEVDLCQLIQSFKRLRILDLHNKLFEKVPRSICKLKYLTYLDLSHNRDLKRLPNSITRLQNLQTLNLKGCQGLEELPRDIRKLVSLRNLDIDGCWELSYVPRGLGQLSSLHRLTRFILPKKKALAKNYCRLGELNGLNNIRGSLSIENLGSVTDAIVESKAANLIGKQSLESLTLNWGDFDIDDVVTWDRDEALLDGLRPYINLQKLSIERYKGESFPMWMMDGLGSSLPNLDEVRFSDCRRCKHLPPLGQLTRLKSLKILWLPELEYIKSDPSSTVSFPSLLKLDVFNCEKLKAMPLAPHLEELSLDKANPALIKMVFGLNKLKSLKISDMDSLEGLPEGCLKSLTSLESLVIGGCAQLTSLSLGVPHVSNLVKFGISNYEELDISKDESGNILDFQGLHGLRSLYIYDLPKLASLPRWLLQASNLEILSLTCCEELDISKDESGNILDFQGLHSLRFVDFSELPELASLPQWLLQLSNLESLSLCWCKELDLSKDESGNILDFQGLPSLRSVHIDRLPKLASLPRWLLQLSNLEGLSLMHCEELDLSKDESGNILDFHGLQSLRSMEIRNLPKLASLPQWLLQLSNLERLVIRNCDYLKELPEQIEALQSLQRLQIFQCRSLTSLPEGMQRLASLTHLNIYGCPDLEKRCEKDAGEDWYKIAHIPNITILP